MGERDRQTVCHSWFKAKWEKRGGAGLFAELNAVNNIRLKLNENQCNYPISMGLNSPWLYYFLSFFL